MPAENLVKFKSGSQESYNNLPEKDNNTLYFIEDGLKIYKGDKPYVKSFWTGTNDQKPQTGEDGILYITTDENKMYVWKPQEAGGQYELAFQSSSVTLDETVTDESTNGVTSKAIYDFVVNKIAEITAGKIEGVFVTQIETGEETGSLTVHRGETDSKEVKVKLKGLIKSPSFDPVSRKLTFEDAETGEADKVEIDLGKDLVVQSGSYDAAEHKIILVLNDESNTKVEINVEDLVSEYKASTDIAGAVKITISDGDAGGKEIKAELQVAESEVLKVENNQLIIDLTSYATTAALTSLTQQVTELQTTVQGLGDIYVKSEDLESKLTEYAKAEDINSQITLISNNVSNLETKIDESLTWGTINV